MTLREQIHTDVEGVFLNVNDFAETFYYLPAGGTRREVVGTVCSERSEVIDVGKGEYAQHMLQVFVSRDSSTGINEPVSGDALWRKSEGTTPAHAWSFTKQVEERDENDGTAYAGQANGWVLLFMRSVTHKHGGLPSQ